MDDPIVEETRRIREQMASQFQYDIQELGRYFQEKQSFSEREIVTLPPKRSHPLKRTEIA